MMRLRTIEAELLAIAVVLLALAVWMGDPPCSQAEHAAWIAGSC